VGKRRRGRELACKVLYRLDLTGEEWDEMRARLEEYDQVEAVRAFGTRLVEAVLAHRPEIDRLLGLAAMNWEVRRMALVDRNVLRVALAEHLVLGDTPPAVIIDEAVEIASRYSTEDSGAFVNGILDRILRAHAAGSLASAGAE
jgi:N utilization substance protein B